MQKSGTEMLHVKMQGGDAKIIPLGENHPASKAGPDDRQILSDLL